MNEPVRVGLVFPRSGQQLFVTVPRPFAATTQVLRTEQRLNTAVRILFPTDSATEPRDQNSRTQ